MKKMTSFIFFLFTIVSAFAIDLGNQYKFDVHALIGKRIIIPTYNGGDNVLHFAFDISTLKSRKFTYKNYYSSPILGQPIKILDYKIFNEGKKDEVFCLIIEHNGNQCVLRFPCNPEYSEYEDYKVNNLFFRENYRQKSYKDIDLRYYLVEEIEKVYDTRKDSCYYLLVKDNKFSGRKYQFKGLSFISYESLFSDKNYKVPNIKENCSFARGLSSLNNLDCMCAVLKNDTEIYVKIQEDELKNTGDNAIELSSINEVLLSESEYKQMFSYEIGIDKIVAANDSLAGRNFYICCNNYDRKKVNVYKKGIKQNLWASISMLSLNDQYVDVAEIKQIKSIEEGQDKFYYYIVGVIESKNDSIAIPLRDDIISCLTDGFEHKTVVSREEAKRKLEEKQHKERIEREEKEYEKKIIKRFGITNAKLILDGRVKIGFTKDMCVESWGEPDMINTTITRTKKWEQWVYGYSTFLYFEGNRLVVIQN